VEQLVQQLAEANLEAKAAEADMSAAAEKLCDLAADEGDNQQLLKRLVNVQSRQREQQEAQQQERKLRAAQQAAASSSKQQFKAEVACTTWRKATL
jgi:hypothetical protein